MDMNFPHKLRRRVAAPVPLLGQQAPDLAILLAVASARQAASPTARCIAARVEEENSEADFAAALARVFAPGRAGNSKTKKLAGCFSPLIAGHLTVGQES